MNKRRRPLTRVRSRRASAQSRTHEGVIEISRLLSFGLDDDTLWETVHDQLAVLFETSSFFIALHDPERARFTLPVVSEDGMHVHYDPIPITGISRGVFVQGVELLFHDLDGEAPRLEALKIERDAREPGAKARSWMGVPLRTKNSEVTGVIALQSNFPYVYGDEELARLLLIAGLLSLALENRRLVQLERERRLIATALMEIGQSPARDYEDVLERVLDQLQRVTGYDSAAALLTNRHMQNGLVVSSSHDPDRFTKGDALAFEPSSPPMQALATGQPIVLQPSEANDTWVNDGASLAWLLLPMTATGRAVGVLALGKYPPHDYTDKDASNAFAVARQGAITLENTRLYAQAQAHLTTLQVRAKRLASISRITGVITAALDRQLILQTAADLLVEMFDADHCGVIIFESNDAPYGELVAEHPPTDNIGLRLPVENNRTLQVLREYGTAVTINDIDSTEVDDTTRHVLQKVGSRSSLIAPLIAGSRYLGSIGIDMLTASRRFTEEDRETLMTIAGQVAMAIANADLYEQALNANHLKTAFLANISHELRTPLNAVIGYSEMLLEQVYGALNEQQIDRMTRVHMSGKHLLTLIDDILDLSKIETGQITMAMRSLRVSDLLDDIITLITPEAQRKNLRLELNVSDSEPYVRADERYLQQLITNLLDNAIKFTAAGHVQLALAPVSLENGVFVRDSDIPLPEPPPPDGDYLLISVTDTGIGIKPEDQSMIFESFRQVDVSASREYGGTGLGLAIAHHLVTMHHGRIWLKSAVGAGTTFYVLLPAINPEPLAAHELPVVQRDSRPLVFVIDDDPTAVQLVKDYLPADDYQVIGTSDPRTALQMARYLQPDVVITDVMMPEVTGWDILRDLKDHGDTATIPVIMLSVVDQKVQGFGVDAADYLVKPVDRDILRTKIASVIRR